MLPIKSIRLLLGTLLAADVGSLAPVAANKIALISAPFSPSEDLLLSMLTLATFTGNAPIAGAAGAQPVASDPATGDQIITITPQLCGYRWVTGDAVGLPQTIYGFCMIDNAGANLLAVHELPAPITLTAAGQQIELSPVTMDLVQRPIS